MSIGTLAIRADANPMIGTGHAMRCLALAQGWQDAGGHIVFAMVESTTAVDQRLREEGFTIIFLDAQANSEEDARAFARLAKEHQAAWAVVDGYHFDAAYQRNLKRHDLSVLLVDDCAQSGEYCADLVLDQNPQANSTMYANRESPTQLLLGTQFVLLRREFLRWGKRVRSIPTVGRNLLITMGGSDPDRLTRHVLAGLGRIFVPNLAITVVAGGSNPNERELQQMIEDVEMPISFLSHAMHIDELMAKSDAALICGGGTLWELLYMGCPTLSYSRTRPQAEIVSALEEMGAVCNMGDAGEIETSHLTAPLESLFLSPSRREAMSNAGRRIVDGKGVSRIIEHMMAGVAA